jgi:chaperonin GroES
MIRPLYDRVVVRRVKEDEKKGLLYIPEQAKEKPAEGVVLAVGTGRSLSNTSELAPLDVKIGERVMFGKYAGTEIEYDGEKLVMLREEEILAVVE